MIKKYLQSISLSRVLIMLLGNVIVGLGISVFKFSGMGNDPFNAMVMAMGEVLNMPYANFQVMLNIGLLVFQILFGRRYIGIGTIVNALLLGYFSTFFNFVLAQLGVTPDALWIRVIIVCLGVLICSLGLSLYQCADVGVAPYDSISLILAERFPKVAYRWFRIGLDALFALIAYLAGGIIGLGTLVCALGLGAFINFFNNRFTKKLFARLDEKKAAQEA